MGLRNTNVKRKVVVLRFHFHGISKQKEFNRIYWTTQYSIQNAQGMALLFKEHTYTPLLTQMPRGKVLHFYR